MNQLKTSFITGVLLALLTATTAAQEKFDIVSFTSPNGWEKDISESSITFGKENGNGQIAIITVFKSMPGNADSKVNFEVAWDSLVKAIVKVEGTAQNRESATDEKTGWTAETGYAKYDNSDQTDGANIGTGIAMLVSLSGGDEMVNVLILTNTQDFQEEISIFVESIVLPSVSSTTLVAPEEDSQLVGKWQRSGSGHPSYADPASWGTAGYTKSRYEFNGDMTYTYTERSFRMAYSQIIIVKESGTYGFNGNKITITPKTSVIESYSKKNGTDELGALMTKKNRTLETATYAFTLHYFEGIKEWNLVLQADAPTARDGKFSGNTAFQNAWYFGHNFTNNDLTSSRGK